MDYEKAKKIMLEGQLRARNIQDERLLAAFSAVDRHFFVPAESQESAYADMPVGIGHGQTISQPYIVALMLQALQLSGTQRVLEIGTGSGYQTALLARLAGHVYSVERLEPLLKLAERNLATLGQDNITLKEGDGSMGWQEHAPFDRIIVSAAAPKIPLPLLQELKDPGVLVMPLGGSFSQMLTVVHKASAKVETTQLCACVFVPLIGLHAYRQES